MREQRQRVHGGAAAAEEEDTDVEQYREIIVEGDVYQALDLARRLLQLDGGHARRRAAAHLLLDRLRGNADVSSDHANAVLRVLANYATSTQELTEELLALLFCSDHRVQIVHHLSALTFQSRACVRLVLSAYVDLLASDRALLVPVLGSLADLPLTAADKALVVDATEGLLDAACEEDVPAVVQSLLSMLVPASAPRIARKIRSQCNRLVASTALALTFNIIMRHAVVGSGVLTAFQRVIRSSETLTPFDIVFLALLLARPSENRSAIRLASTVVTNGSLSRQVIRDTMQMLRNQKWHEAFPCFVRLASALLSGCFNSFRTHAIAVAMQCAIDILSNLVIHRTNAQEEALSLLLSIVSQPQRLVLSTSRSVLLPVTQALSWEVAYCVADHLAHIAGAHPISLSPFAHIFLDHLYGIAAASTQSFSFGADAVTESSYPTAILESLCKTMVLLARHEPGMVSLLMITIQKQLVAPIGATTGGTTTALRIQASHVAQVKQLMAVFLAGEMLRQGVGEKSDRSSLLNWIRKLVVSSAVSDETTAQVVRLLGSNSVRNTLSPSDLDGLSTLLSEVFRRQGFELRGYAEIAKIAESSSTEVEILPGLVEQNAAWVSSSLIFDVIKFVRTMRLGLPPIGWQALVDHQLSSSDMKAVEKSIRATFALLPVHTQAFLSVGSVLSTEHEGMHDKALMCSFALPPVTEATFSDWTLPSTLWSYACALQVAITTTNMLVVKQQDRTKGLTDVVRQRKRLLQRVQVCWVLHKRVCALVEEAGRRLKPDICTQGGEASKSSSSAWLQLQVGIIGTRAGDYPAQIVPTSATSDLTCLGRRLSLEVVSAIFDGLWKNPASTIESGLEIELFRAFPAQFLATNSTMDDFRGWKQKRPDEGSSSGSLYALVRTQEGKRTLKYLSRRLFDYADQLASLDEDATNEDSQNDESAAEGVRTWVLEGIRSLCSAMRSIIEVSRANHRLDQTGCASSQEELWGEVSLELLAKGAVDERIRKPSEQAASGWASYCEILLRCFMSGAVQTKASDIVCEFCDVLLSLTSNTRVQAQVCRLNLALLHTPYPSSHVSDALARIPRKLPLPKSSSTTAVISLLRPLPPKFHHVVYFIVGSWTISPSTRVGLTHLAYIVDCMEALTNSSNASALNRAAKSRQRRDKKASEPEVEDDIAQWIARDGEHRILKNLTNDTLPLFLEVVYACLSAAPLRASPSQSRDQQLLGGSPFIDHVGAFAVLSKALRVFITAELAGFNLPHRTASALLRSGPRAMKNIEQSIKACLLWRGDEELNGFAGSLSHVQSLLEAAEGLVVAMDQVAASFQEKFVLTVQQRSTHSSAAKGDNKSKGAGAGRWGSELLRKTYGNQFQRRKPLSKSEAKLLPYFTHSIEQLRSFLAETCAVYRIDVFDDQVSRTEQIVVKSLRLDEDELERMLSLLLTSDAGENVSSYAFDESLDDTWREMHPDDDLEEALTSVPSDEDESSNPGDEDVVSEDELPIRVAATLSNAIDEKKRSKGDVHTLVPQKKRLRTSTR